MDAFCEQIVKAKRTVKDNLIVTATVIAALVLSFFAYLLGGLFIGIWVFMVIGIWYGAWYIITNTVAEYEYIMTNSELDIDIIRAKRSRKHMLSVDVKTFTVCADAQNPLFHNAAGLKTVNALSSAKDAKRYFAVFDDNGIKTCLIFSPNDSVLEAIKHHNPDKVISD